MASAIDPNSFQELLSFTYSASAAAWVFFAIASIIFFMRTFARVWYSDAGIQWDDTLITLSWLLDIVRVVSFQLACQDTRLVDFNNPAATVPPAVFWALFTDTWAFLSITLPKIAVAVLLVRIFRPRPWVRRCILGLPIGLFIVCIAGFAMSFGQCTPAAGQWDPFSHPDVVCWPRNIFIDYALVASSTSAFTDLAFAIYPAVVVWQLQMSTVKKLSVMVVMGLGLASFAFATIKVSQNATLLGNPNVVELFYHALHIGLWNSLEGSFVLIAACLPGARPLLKTRGRRTQGSSMGYSSSNFSGLRSRNRNDKHIPLEEQEIGIARYGSPPGEIPAAGIRVKYDVHMHKEELSSKGSAGSFGDGQSYGFAAPTESSRNTTVNYSGPPASTGK